MKPSPLPTLPEALAWMAAHWTVRELPLRLHAGGVEPDSQWGAPRISPAFLRYLDARCDDTYTDGPALPRYRYPMWRALVSLAAQRDDPPPLVVILALVDVRLSPDVLLVTHGIDEPTALRAIRRLHHCYATGPVPRRAWTLLSESQQNAELSGGGVAA